MADVEGARRAMKSWGLWTIRVLLVCLGLLLAIGSAASALDSTTELGVLSRVGELLTGFGWLGAYVSLAIGLPAMWRRLGQSTPPPPARGGGLRGRRRANRRVRRQIDGAEPYGDDEIPYLRWVAERRVAARRWSPTTWLTWLSLIAVYAGCVLHPLEMPADFGQYIWGSGLVPVWPILALVTRILAGAMLLLFVIVAVTSWRMRNEEKAIAFLARTRSVARPTNGTQ